MLESVNRHIKQSSSDQAVMVKLSILDEDKKLFELNKIILIGLTNLINFATSIDDFKNYLRATKENIQNNVKYVFGELFEKNRNYFEEYRI